MRRLRHAWEPLLALSVALTMLFGLMATAEFGLPATREPDAGRALSPAAGVAQAQPGGHRGYRALLYPGRRVMAVCGDGGFMMNSQELETAVRLKVNLVVLVIEDHAFGMIRWKQATDRFQDFGMTFGNPDFVAYAQAYGAKGTRVGSVDELLPALEAAFTGGGVHLVVVPVDYSENKRVLVDELRQRLPVPAASP